MGSLIKNEYIKIFKKKSTYIVLIILFIFVILTNIIYKFMDNILPNYDYRTSDDYIASAREEIKNINVESDRQHYIELKTDIDYYELYKKYDKDSWQAYLIKRDFYGYLYNMNLYKYGTHADKESLTENPEEIYNKKLEKLNNSDWKQYVNEEIKVLESQVNQLKQAKEAQSELTASSEMDDQISVLQTKLDLAKLRLEKDIPYGDNFINEAIEVRTNHSLLDDKLDEPNMSFRDKLMKQEEVETYEKAKYVIDNKQDINNRSDARAVMLNLFDEYSIFIIIFLVMIAGGMISSEMEKGTIKMLLVKPYSRTKILLAKYIVSLSMIFFIFAVIAVLQTIVGGIILGFDSLSVPAVVYNFSTHSLETYNLFAYVGIMAIHKLPIYILMTTLSFALSVLFGHTVLAVVLPIVGNIGSSLINQLASYYSIKQLAIFPTLNWDFSQFMNGRIPNYEFTSLGFASAVCIVYWLIMIVVSWLVFNKKEIKNI